MSMSGQLDWGMLLLCVCLLPLGSVGCLGGMPYVSNGYGDAIEARTRGGNEHAGNMIWVRSTSSTEKKKHGPSSNLL